MTLRCKFNFSYLDINQNEVVDFDALSENELKNLTSKIKNFSEKSLEQLKKDKNFLIYGDFPEKTKLKHPKFVPQKVKWGRFRLEGAFRLAGFVVPAKIANEHENLDTNTFYVVFLDINHKFYLSEKKHT